MYFSHLNRDKDKERDKTHSRSLDNNGEVRSDKGEARSTLPHASHSRHNNEKHGEKVTSNKDNSTEQDRKHSRENRHKEKKDRTADDGVHFVNYLQRQQTKHKYRYYYIPSLVHTVIILWETDFFPVNYGYSYRLNIFIINI